MIINNTNPDLLVVWGAYNISHWLLFRAEQILPQKVVYYFADYWPTLQDAYTQHWQGKGRRRFTRLPFTLLARAALKILQHERLAPALKFENTICVSRAVRDVLVDGGFPIQHAPIIYNGIHFEDFYKAAVFRATRSHQPYFSLLYAGRLTHEKGVHLAIEAVAGLIPRGQMVNLEIIGHGPTSYIKYLENLVDNLKIKKYVNFSKHVRREKMPQILGSHDILLVPSLWPEPLPRIIQEGMAAGLVVIGARIGGITEAIDDGVDGLCFSHDDVDDLIKKIEILCNSPDLYSRLSKAGIQKAASKFDINRTVDEIEAFLSNVASEA